MVCLIFVCHGHVFCLRRLCQLRHLHNLLPVMMTEQLWKERVRVIDHFGFNFFLSRLIFFEFWANFFKMRNSWTHFTLGIVVAAADEGLLLFLVRASLPAAGASLFLFLVITSISSPCEVDTRTHKLLPSATNGNSRGPTKNYFENGFSHVNKEVRNFFNFVPSFSYIKKMLKIEDIIAKCVYFRKKLVPG